MQVVFNITVVVFTVANLAAMGLETNLAEALRTLRSARAVALICSGPAMRWTSRALNPSVWFISLRCCPRDSGADPAVDNSPQVMSLLPLDPLLPGDFVPRELPTFCLRPGRRGPRTDGYQSEIRHGVADSCLARRSR